MSVKIERLRNAIAQSVQRKVENNLSAQIEYANVKSVESDGTCTVQMLTDREGDVTPGIATSLYSNMKMKPAMNSKCLVAHIMNEDAEGFIIWCDKIEEVTINGDELGGLVIGEKLNDNLKAIKNYVMALKAATSNALNAVGAGPAANGPGASLSFNAEMASKAINFSEMENKKIKHGEG